MSFECLSIDDAETLMAAEDVTVIDMRDPESFAAGHIEAALPAAELDMDRFLAETDKDAPLLLYCYHGISSQSAAQFLASNGFTRVYSMDGGYTAWEMLASS